MVRPPKGTGEQIGSNLVMNAIEAMIRSFPRGSAPQQVPSHQTFAGTVAFSDAATDQALMATAKMGDEEAFEPLVKRHRTRIFSLALRYTRVREDAEDVVQQTFQKRHAST